jgi:hypothetical protein
MQQFQLKFQRVLITGCLILAAGSVLYALGFATDLYPLIYHTDPGSSLFYVPGAEVYTAIQPFNRAFFMHTIWLFLVCVTLFLSLTHRRRLYYASNYITSVAFAGGCAALGAELITHALEFKAAYLLVDFERLREVTEAMKLDYVESTFMLDLGIALSALLFATAALVCLNLVLKTVWMRQERWLEPETGEVTA